MFLQTLVILAASILTDREPSPEEIAMKNRLLAELAAKGSLTFANQSDLVLYAKRVEGNEALDVHITRLRPGQPNFRFQGKRAKLRVDLERGWVYIGLFEGAQLRESGPRELEDMMQIAVRLMDLAPAGKERQ